MKRVDHIKNKLSHVQDQQKSLHDLLFFTDLGKEDLLPKISNRVGDILANTTECLEYAAHDIIEYEFQNPPTIYYFPFYLDQLKKKPWSNLASTSPTTFQALQSTVQKIEDNSPIPKTIFFFQTLRKIHELVRNKKHMEIITIEPSSESEIQISMPGGMRIVLPPQPLTRTSRKFQISKGVQITQKPEYIIKSLNIPVHDLCLAAEQTTRFALTELYRSIFNNKTDFRSAIPEGEV